MMTLDTGIEGERVLKLISRLQGMGITGKVSKISVGRRSQTRG